MNLTERDVKPIDVASIKIETDHYHRSGTECYLLSQCIVLYNLGCILFILTVFGKCNACYGSRMTREVSYVRPLFQIPYLYHGIFGSSAKDKTIRVELSTR